MKDENKNPIEISPKEPTHRLDAYFQGYQDGPFIKNLAVMDAINAAISPLRGLDDLLCCGKFDSPELVTKACGGILHAAISDLDYVIEKWGAFGKIQDTSAPRVGLRS